MTKEHFDKGLKLLKRFLKEEGKYKEIFEHFLFRDRRPIEDLFKEFNSKTYFDVDNWSYLFNRINLMSWKGNFNYALFNDLIEKNNIRTKWVDYCKQNGLNVYKA